MITNILDKIRITLGDSKCPLSHKCPGYDLENDCCSSYKGRIESLGDRAECYNYFKPLIKSQKQGLLSKLAEKITTGFIHIGGLDE